MKEIRDKKNRENMKKYTDENPEVNKKAVKRYNKS